MIQIQNGILKAGFLSKGAELRTLISSSNNQEWMWQANPAFWGKTSPILFPIVGGLKNDSYHYNGATFHLPRHGFARDKEFEIRKQEESKIVFGLSSDETTKAIYPFDFDLEVEYSLKENALQTTYRVKNTTQKAELWFSLGAHPAFAIDVDERKAFSDYKIRFSNDNELHLHPLHNNLLQQETRNVPLQQQSLPLAYSLFENDALVMTDMKSKELVLENSTDKKGLCFRFTNFPYFGIWSARDANFVCLEPWAGIADFEHHNGNLTQKFGMISLPPNGQWKAEWSVELQA